MKILTAMLMVSLLLLTGCHVGLHGHGHGHYRVRHHHYRHHGHHRHHHWNGPGPAYGEASKITEIKILSATLPDDFEGEFSSDEEAAWRKAWPDQAAQLVAAGLTTGTNSQVTATFSETKPTSGYYMTLEITYIDIGDPRPNADGTPKQRGSALSARGVIMNAESGKMVADVKFSESSGWTGTVPFDGYMSRIGGSLAEWFNDKRENE
jgi:hypothetical protein